MKTMLRAVLTICLLLAAALTAYPSLAQDVGFDFWNANELQFGLANQEGESRKLDQESETTVHRTLIRVEICGDVIEGRMTFAEGMAQFAEVNRANPKVLAFTRMTYGGESDEVRAGWQLVAHLRVHSHPNANKVADAGERWLRGRN